jgi:hypothetical protein
MSKFTKLFEVFQTSCAQIMGKKQRFLLRSPYLNYTLRYLALVALGERTVLVNHLNPAL